ncbi:MAG: glycosyltransferase family 1 protein, partial [Methanosphaera stadtmanae]|nr:glycosyltransferase family 1 protein [Methanosphaera stadtmanae]
DFVSDATGKESILFPIATDTDMFNENILPNEEYQCDYCFTGSYWDAKREIIDYLNPNELDYKFNLYGANWEKIEKLAPYHKGFINYNQVPELYSSTKIVIDDANHVTKQWASVNSRVFDALAIGRLVLTNGSLGNDEIFDGQIPEYHSQEELKEQLIYYMENPDERKRKIESLKRTVLENHTYEIRANTFKQILRKFIDKYKIAIKIPAPRWTEVHKWGDFYLAEGLLKEFTKKGYFIKLQILPEWDDSSDSICDAVIVLRGLSQYTPKLQHYNIMWNISHPNNVKLKEYELYDHVFIASHKWADTISSRVNVPVECMWQCTDTDRFYPDYSPEYHHELLFVGNSRKVHRKILKDLLPTEHELAVYGSDWKRHINKKYIIAEHIDNKELRKAYSSCDILLNDHWDDMREKGFVSNRIFDAIACGTCIISDDIDGLEELFNDRVITYHNKNELKGLVDENLENKKSYDIEIIEGHTYSDRVEQFIEVLK